MHSVTVNRKPNAQGVKFVRKSFNVCGGNLPSLPFALHLALILLGGLLL